MTSLLLSHPKEEFEIINDTTLKDSEGVYYAIGNKLFVMIPIKGGQCSIVKIVNNKLLGLLFTIYTNEQYNWFRDLYSFAKDNAPIPPFFTKNKQFVCVKTETEYNIQVAKNILVSLTLQQLENISKLPDSCCYKVIIYINNTNSKHMECYNKLKEIIN